MTHRVVVLSSRVDDARAWCHQHLGPRDTNWKFDYEYEDGQNETYTRVRCCFYFQDKKNATLFKLSWV